MNKIKKKIKCAALMETHYHNCTNAERFIIYSRNYSKNNNQQNNIKNFHNNPKMNAGV